MVIAQLLKRKQCEVVNIRTFGQKWHHFVKCFQAKGYSVEHSLYYYYSTFTDEGGCIVTKDSELLLELWESTH